MFHTPGGEPFVIVEPDGIVQTLPIRSRALKTFLAASYYESAQEAPTADSVRQALAVLEGRALFEGDEHEVYTRVAPGPDGASIYLDLADPEWRAVRIDAAGWDVVAKPPVRFRRAAGMLALPRPERGGTLESLRPFVNVANDDCGDFELPAAGWSPRSATRALIRCL